MKNLLRAWKENCRIVGMKTRTKNKAVRTGKIMIISQEVNDKMNIQMIDNQIIIK